ncbi:DUF962 domain-containing protein [Fictibacillus fluitans]|uniref:DUF962 domain-containing protein n=1 Tax=Fictibacillus fluitans TaxID=3058422 RepID=A0ABT8I2J5_9BACL|nr:DUF962 domain-containing protein [Fictibacillus sp. NE201]MDN4527257.1 DUF962 domain-containing protein [Fictibacillus sp. NE201]
MHHVDYQTEKTEIKTFEEFWVFYLSQHSKKSTRAWHFTGTSLVFIFLALGATTNAWFLLAAPISAYSLAWYSHFFVEGNKPATFGHPLWSLRADFRMFFFTLTGRLEHELKKRSL